MRFRTSCMPRSTAVVKPKVGISGGSGRSLSMVLGTWTTAIRPPAARATSEVAKAVSSPPMVRRYETSRRRSDSTTCWRASGDRVGLARAVRRIEPPSKWIWDSPPMSSSCTRETSPSMSHLKPSSQPSTRSPRFRASMVAAAMTALMPGAGPPPTRIASVFMGSGYATSCSISGRYWPERARPLSRARWWKALWPAAMRPGSPFQACWAADCSARP